MARSSRRLIVAGLCFSVLQGLLLLHQDQWQRQQGFHRSWGTLLPRPRAPSCSWAARQAAQMQPKRRRGLAALLVLAAVAAAVPAAAGQAPPLVTACPDPRTTSRVLEGCPCSPVRNATRGACAAGFVCAQKWTDQVAAAQRSVRRLLSADGAGAGIQPGTALYPGGGATADPSGVGAGGSEAPAFSCQACGYGQLCPAGSVLPPVLDPSIQL